MLDYNEIKPGKCIIYNGEPYQVVEAQVSRKQQRKPQNQAKLRNLLNGRVIPATFHAADRVDEAEIGKKEVKFLYSQKPKNEYWFCDPKNPSDRFTIPSEIIGDNWKYMVPNAIIEIDTFGEDTDLKIIGVTLPIKVDLKVVEAPPVIRGDTASGGGKPVTVETGAQINTPFFVVQGDVIRVNTQTGEYTERANK